MDITNVDDNILATIVLQFNHKRLFAISKSLRLFLKIRKTKRKTAIRNQQSFYKFISIWHKCNYRLYGVEQQHSTTLYPYNPNLDST